MKNRSQKTWAALIACALLLPSAGQAIPLTLLNALGEIQPGTATNPTEDTAFVNSVVDRANGAVTSVWDLPGYGYTVINDPAPLLPFAVFVSTGAVGGDHEVDLGAGGYQYLLVKYDGAQGTALVWDIAGMSGSISVADKNSGGFTHNNYSLFNAVPTTNVPEAGSTFLLLGAAITSLGLLGRSRDR